MKLNHLTTETRNKNTENIDQLDALGIATLINQEDQKVALAIQEELPNIAKAIDAITEKYLAGGRIIYMGAGTSGRLGTIDAVELTPTYGVPSDRVFGLMAGGQGAMYKAVEGAEDSRELGVKDLEEVNFSEKDVLIAIAASGRTPYAIAGIEYANNKGALTVSVTCNKDSEMNKIAQVGIAPVVGPEVVTGSTRMKAGTAQKMVLNMLSTGVMIQSGKVYGNLMVNVQPTNEKLVARSIGIIEEITGVSREEATKLFEDSGRSVAVAVVMQKGEVAADKAKELLEKANGKIREALKSI